MQFRVNIYTSLMLPLPAVLLATESVLITAVFVALVALILNFSNSGFATCVYRKERNQHDAV
jgi:hypothetical protein